LNITICIDLSYAVVTAEKEIGVSYQILTDWEVFFKGARQIRAYDEAGNVIETHEHAGGFRKW
jgi:hypothetical protein